MTFSKEDAVRSDGALTGNKDFSREILRAVDELKNGSGFGSVEIILHEGRVTQIEKREKVRFSPDGKKSNPTAKAVA